MTSPLTIILLGLAGFVIFGLLMLVGFLWGKQQSKTAQTKEELLASKKQNRIPTTVTSIPRGGIAQTKFSVSSPERGEKKK